MTARKLLFGALIAAPFFISPAWSQTDAGASTPTVATPVTTATPAAASPVPAATPALPAASATPKQPDADAAAGSGQAAAPAATPTARATAATPTDPAAAAPAAPPPGAVASPTPKPKKVAPLPPPLETALSTDPQPTVQPGTFFATAKASERYGAIVDAGGWPTDVKPLRPGDKGLEVAKLRKRLAIEGDLPGLHAAGQSWGPELTDALKRFQARMGLKQTGVVAGATLKAMNVPASVRFNELASSANRLAGANFPFEDRYVAVNIPSTAVEAIDKGVVAHRYVAIVGDPDHPSPEITAHVQVVNLNPTWTVPTSIITKEIIPRMQRDPGYLTRAKIRILDGSGNEIHPKAINWSTERAASYTLRQDSGAGNSLGSIRIGMPNKLAVYMHDTPSKRLFGADYRFLSHGCVRVQGVYDLAEWLLQGTGGPAGAWTKPDMLEKVKESAPYDIRLAHPVPVIWVYLTGWANGDGPANFRDDVYGLDTVAGPQASAATLQPVR
jgi:L,D-transpeptidase YcbB